jgi:hypothetical protein
MGGLLLSHETNSLVKSIVAQSRIRTPPSRRQKAFCPIQDMRVEPPMSIYENTKFLMPFLESHADQIRQGLNETAEGDDQVQVVAGVLSAVLSQDSDIQEATIEAFWKSIDWRLLADMYLGKDEDTFV